MTTYMTCVDKSLLIYLSYNFIKWIINTKTMKASMQLSSWPAGREE